MKHNLFSSHRPELIREVPRLLLLEPDLELLALVVEVAVRGHPRLGLPLEERVVELLVVDVDLAQLRADLLAHLGLHRLAVLLFLGVKDYLNSARFTVILNF